MSCATRTVKKDLTEYYECDECGYLGEAFEFELADKKGQLCLECVLESF